MDKNFVFKKRFGQNFLSDKNLLAAIVKDAQINDNDTVLEVGAGAGALTVQLAAVAKKVVALEIDTELQHVLQQALQAYHNVRLVFCDALKLSDEQLFDLVGDNYAVVANLPYYITTPLIFRFLESNFPPKSLTLTVQKEVADRIVAQPNSPDYGALSVNCQYLCDVKVTRKLSRKLFYPVPNVDSAVVHLQRKEGVQNFAMFSRLVRAAFAMRRKTLVNNLTSEYGITRVQAEQALHLAGLDYNVRGEVLGVAEFLRLLEVLAKI